MPLQCLLRPRAPFMSSFGVGGDYAGEERAAVLRQATAGLPPPLPALYAAFCGALRPFLFHLLEDEERPVTDELLPACFLLLLSE